jgi:hypothetical protein
MNRKATASTQRLGKEKGAAGEWGGEGAPSEWRVNPRSREEEDEMAEECEKGEIRADATQTM